MTRPLLLDQPAAWSGTSATTDDVFMFPTSFAQRRLWFLDQFEPGSPLYNVPMAVRFAGGVDVDAVRAAVQTVVDRHEILRTTFAAVDGEPMQVVGPRLYVPLPLMDLSGRANRDAELARRLSEQAQRPFDLAIGPLFRAELLRVDQDDYVLALMMHHIVSDGWSTGVLIHELSVLYDAYRRGEPSPLPPLQVQYADFAVWQRDALRGDALERHLGYWKQQLAGAPAVLELPSDHPRPPMQEFRGGGHTFRLEADVAHALRAAAAREGVTLFMAALAGFYALLYRYTGQSDLVVGTPIANRLRAELEPLIGFFVNTLVLRVPCHGGLSFAELLARVRAVTVDAYDHQDMPFDRLVEELQPERVLSHNPLFQVMFMLQSAPTGSVTGSVSTNGASTNGASTNGAAADVPTEGTAGSAPPVAGAPVGSGTAKFDLILSLTETADALYGAIEYRTDMFDHDRIARMAVHFERLLRSALAAPDRPIRELEILPTAERQQLLERWNQTRVEYPVITIPEAFARQAARRASATAVQYGDEHVTYAALRTRANRLARHLRRLGVRPGSVVGICMRRSVDMVTAMLAVVSAGGAYVPLEAAYPPERVAYMVDDAALALIVAHSANLPILPADRVRVVCVDGEAAEAIAAESSDPLPPAALPDDVAYVIYTSGSTGRPKGSAVTHRGVLRLVHRGTIVPFAPEDHVAQLSNASFDPSVFEIWGALLNGAHLVGLTLEATSSPLELVAQLRMHRISVVFVTTAVFNYLARETPDLFAGVGTVVFGGEAADPRAVAAVLAAGAPKRLVNGYGPTECSVFSTYHEITAVSAGESIPIGVPVTNCRVYVLDALLRPTPIGIPGEIYVGGDGVGDSYFRRSRLTAERFVPDPYSLRAGARLYRTGDLGRYRAEGVVEYLGRTDTQVKIRGYRVELGEVEEVLRRHGSVQEAAMVARYDTPGGRLAAFVVPHDGAVVEPGELRALVRAHLPEYMAPATYTAVAGIPLTPNGKVDRAALAGMEQGRIQADAAFVAPRTATEATIAGIWTEVLGISQCSVEEDFFHLGGHSLLATQVMSRLRRALGVELPLRALFEAPTVAGLAALADDAGIGRRPDPVLARRVSGAPNRFPLSFAQERLWFLDQLRPGNTAYNVPAAFRFAPAASLPALRATLFEIAHRHETLRTTFSKIDGRPVQVVGAPDEVLLSVVDLSEYEPEARLAETSRLQAAEAGVPFDLERGPLFRALLLRHGAEDVLCVTMHHIVSDGWSMGLFAHELQTLYAAFARGDASPLPELPVQYGDFARWQRDYLDDQKLGELVEYWRRRLDGAPPLLALPTDRPRPPMQSFDGAVLSTHVGQPTIQRLRALAEAEGATLFMALLAAFAVLLERWSGQPDVVVGSPIANRTRPEIEGLIGFFVNTLVLRCDVSGEPTFRGLVARVREVTLEAYAHQDLPFEKLVEELQPARSLSHPPLFQVMFMLQNLPTMDAAPADPPPALPSAAAPLVGGPTQAKFDLSLAAVEDPWGLALSFEHNTTLFDTSSVQRFAAAFEVLLVAAGREPDQPISALPLLTAAERVRLVEAQNATDRDYGPFVPLAQQIAEQATRTPNAAAVVLGGERLSYAELLARADQVAGRLARRGIGAESIVAVFIERSLDLVVALVGILRAGAAYLPLDVDYPSERLRFFLADSGTRVVLTTQGLAERVPSADAEVLYVDVDADPAADVAPPPSGLMEPDQLAYVIYTSGSTGRPKGAMNTHGAIVNRLRWMQEEMQLVPGDRVVQKTPTSFDVSVWELFWPLSVGATVVLAVPGGHRDPAYVRDLVIGSEATTIHFVPSMLRQFLDVPGIERCTSLRRVVCSGEQLTSEIADRLGARLSARLYNLYGPTEAAVDVTFAVVSHERHAGPAVPIGRPIANTRIHILDERYEPVPVGVAGHLHIGGANVGRGYHRRPALTAERFMPDPFSAVPGERLYRTGDIAVRRADGLIEFVGRMDQQVKLRGFRIELGEIEAALREHPAVDDAVVDLRSVGAEAPRLVAYVVPCAGGQEWADAATDDLTDSLRAHLGRRLPDHMVPSVFVGLAALPLAPSGKVDRRALPQPAAQARGSREYVAPRDVHEATLAAIWAEVLGVEHVGVHDDFFELGGHSLLATQVVSRIRTHLQLEVPLQAIFESPTVADLRARLGEVAEPGDAEALRPITRAGDGIDPQATIEVDALSDDEVRAMLDVLLAEDGGRS